MGISQNPAERLYLLWKEYNCLDKDNFNDRRRCLEAIIDIDSKNISARYHLSQCLVGLWESQPANARERMLLPTALIQLEVSYSAVSAVVQEYTKEPTDDNEKRKKQEALDEKQKVYLALIDVLHKQIDLKQPNEQMIVIADKLLGYLKQNEGELSLEYIGALKLKGGIYYNLTKYDEARCIFEEAYNAYKNHARLMDLSWTIDEKQETKDSQEKEKKLEYLKHLKDKQDEVELTIINIIMRSNEITLMQIAKSSTANAEDCFSSKKNNSLTSCLEGKIATSSIESINEKCVLLYEAEEQLDITIFYAEFLLDKEGYPEDRKKAVIDKYEDIVLKICRYAGKDGTKEESQRYPYTLGFMLKRVKRLTELTSNIWHHMLYGDLLYEAGDYEAAKVQYNKVVDDKIVSVPNKNKANARIMGIEFILNNMQIAYELAMDLMDENKEEKNKIDKSKKEKTSEQSISLEERVLVYGLLALQQFELGKRRKAIKLMNITENVTIMDGLEIYERTFPKQKEYSLLKQKLEEHLSRKTRFERFLGAINPLAIKKQNRGL